MLVRFLLIGYLCWDRVCCQVALSDANQARSKATEWLSSRWQEPRNGVATSLTGGWDESNTARVLTGLQLADNQWILSPANRVKSNLALKQMNSDILNGLLRTANMSTMAAEEGAEYINALIATCQNPTDWALGSYGRLENFFGHNLGAMLVRRLPAIPGGTNNKNVVQVIAATLALCNARINVPASAIQRINSELKPSSGSCPYCVEASSLAILAMKCLRETSPAQAADPLVQGITTRQIAYVKSKQEADGGFGDVLATALAVQAANAVGTVNLPINVAAALSYIISDQDKQTGSFGNPVLTAFVLPTLIGRSLVDVRNVPCPPQSSLDAPVAPGRIRLTLVVDDTIYTQRIVETKVETSAGQSILQVMNEEAARHPRAFKFTTANAGGAQLTGINSVVNDSKNNWSWRVLRSGAGDSTAQPVAALDRVTVQPGDKITFRFGRP